MPTPSCSLPCCSRSHRFWGQARFLARTGALITSFPAGPCSPGQPGSQHVPSSVLQAKPGLAHLAPVPLGCPAAARGPGSSPRQRRGKERFQDQFRGTEAVPSTRPQASGPGRPWSSLLGRRQSHTGATGHSTRDRLCTGPRAPGKHRDGPGCALLCFGQERAPWEGFHCTFLTYKSNTRQEGRRPCRVFVYRPIAQVLRAACCLRNALTAPDVSIRGESAQERRAGWRYSRPSSPGQPRPLLPPPLQPARL